MLAKVGTELTEIKELLPMALIFGNLNLVTLPTIKDFTKKGS
jgi:hypothetical protein